MNVPYIPHGHHKSTGNDELPTPILLILLIGIAIAVGLACYAAIQSSNHQDPYYTGQPITITCKITANTPPYIIEVCDQLLFKGETIHSPQPLLIQSTSDLYWETMNTTKSYPTNAPLVALIHLENSKDILYGFNITPNNHYYIIYENNHFYATTEAAILNQK